MDCQISIRGEIDLATAPQLEIDLQRAIQASDGRLILDCTQLKFMDSTGVTVLEGVRLALQGDKRDLRIEHLPYAPRRVCEVLELTDLLRCCKQAGRHW